MNQYVWVYMSEALNRASERTLNSCAHKSHKEEMICIISLVINRMFDRSNMRKRGYIWNHGSVNTVYHDREGMAVGIYGHMGPGLLQISQCLGQKWHYVYSSRLTFQWPSRLHLLKVPQLPKTAPPAGDKVFKHMQLWDIFHFQRMAEPK